MSLKASSTRILRRTGIFFSELLTFYTNSIIRNPFYVVPGLFIILEIIFFQGGIRVLLCVVIFLFALFTILSKKKFVLILVISIGLLSVSLLIDSVRFRNQLTLARNVFDNSESGKEYEIIFRIKRKLKGDSQVLFAQVNGANTYATFPRYPVVPYGSKCLVRGTVRFIGNDSSDFAEYLKSKKTFLSARVSVNRCVKHRQGISAIFYIYDLKDRIIRYVERALREPYASLFVGILFGEERIFSARFDEVVKATGISHVVAASGYNIQFVEIISRAVLNKLAIKRKDFLIVLVSWLYVFIAGMGASVIRAGLGSSVYVLSAKMGYPMSSFMNIVLVVGIMLMINPHYHADLGFQLSVIATCAIVYISPVIEYIFHINENILIPVLCTIYTAPALISNFGGYSVIGPLAGMLALWSVQDIMGLGFLGLLLGVVSKPLSLIVLRLSESLLWCFTIIVEQLSRLSFLNGNLPVWLVYYAILIISIIWFINFPAYMQRNVNRFI